jgi:hypothetical protein
LVVLARASCGPEGRVTHAWGWAGGPASATTRGSSGGGGRDASEGLGDPVGLDAVGVPAAAVAGGLDDDAGDAGLDEGAVP